MKTSSDVKRILADSDYLYGQDGNWRSYLQDVFNFCLPRKAWITSHRVTGERLKDSYLYDIRAIRCVKEATCGIHSHLTNPSARWFQSAYTDLREMQSGTVQKYLKECDDIMFDVVNDSNFDDSILENYMDHLVAGTGNLHTEEDETDEVRFKEIPVDQYSFVEDSRGRVLKVYRRFTFTAIQCIDRWGSKCPKEVHDAMKEKPYTTFEIVHYIGPRDKRNPYKEDRENMPWESCWIMKKPEMLLAEGGYQEMPSAIGRWWRDANDPHGFSPAMDALASIKLLNAEKRTFIRSAMKASDPAFLSPYRGFINSPNFNPSAMNYYDKKKFNVTDFHQFVPQGNYQVNAEAMDLEASEIERAFYVDVFRAISSVTSDRKKRSIPEVQRVIAEGMSMLGPIVGKLVNETLDPTLERVRAICYRRMILPPEPPQLKDRKKKIIYLSPLARAQKQSQMIGISAWLQALMELANMRPDVLDPVKFDKVSKTIAGIQGVDGDFYFSDQQVADLRAQRAKAKAAAQQVAMAEQGASAAHKGSQARKNLAEAAEIGK